MERAKETASQLLSTAKIQSKRYWENVKELTTRHDAITDEVYVSRDHLLRQFNDVKSKCGISYWKDRFYSKFIKGGVDFDFHDVDKNRCVEYIKISGLTKTKDGFIFEAWNGYGWVKPDKFSILKFSDKWSFLLNVFDAGLCLKLDASIRKTNRPKVDLYHVERLYGVDFVDHDSCHKAQKYHQSLKEQGISLSKAGWIRKANPKEVADNADEKASIVNRIDFFTTLANRADYASGMIEPKLAVISELIFFLRKKNVTPSSLFPNSMTFVRDRNYQAVHKNFKLLMDAVGLQDENLLVALERVSAMGLVNMPLLYERWVLLQIIHCLIEVYRFVPEDNWKYKLVEAISSDKEVSIAFANESAHRYIDLTFQCWLDNGNRPDFVIDLHWYPRVELNRDSQIKKRFVIDAKFYNTSAFAAKGGIAGVMHQLYESKDYSESGQNPVFIVHPCRNAIEQPASPQSWSRHSYLGESNLLDEELFDHNRGAVYLSPIHSYNYRDELQRMLGLFLQYKLEDSEIVLGDDATVAVPICIRCGSTEIKGRFFSRSYRAVCSECEHIQVHNHCGNRINGCNTRIIKNGPYWSYHSAMALQPYNLRCPKCGSFGNW